MTTPGPDVAPRTDALLRRLVRRDAGTALNKFIARLRIEDLAAAVEHLTWDEQRRLYRLVEDQDLRAQLLAFLPAESVREVTAGLTGEQVAELIDRLEPDDATDVVSELADEMRKQVLAELMDDPTGEEVKELLEYPPDSAGGIMHPMVFTVRDHTSCGQAIASIQASNAEHEVIYYVYVVDPADRLVGVTSLRSLLSNSPKTQIVDIMTRGVISVTPLTDQEEVARFVARYDLLAIPVVGPNREILGVVTVDDIIDVLREEAGEDMLLMAGVNAEPDRSVFRQARSRAGWLLATIFGGLVASEVIGQYTGTLQAVTALAGFIPVITGMGGNVGIQSATLSVRGLAIGRVQPEAPIGFIWEQVRVSLILGALFAGILVLYGIFRHPHDPLVGVSAGSSLFVAICMSGTFGAAMPVALLRAGVDPAVATGPFVTTLIDVVSILVYFNIARLLLGL
ncbi:MAG: magnesium transporter [Deltaproteobacteria bacterium]|nr:magnesium transporter [Deltaproteobacteria bacterium]